MSNLSKTKITIIAIGVLSILGAIAVSAIGLVPQQELSSEQATDAVKSFAEVNGVKSVVKDELAGKRSVYEVQTLDNRIFWVDAKSGKVTGAMGKLGEQPVNSNELPLTKETALRRAETFIKSKYDRFSELTLVDQYVGPGDSITFGWVKIDENGARLPRWASISVDLKTGRLGSYSSRDDETVISTKPQITKDQALSTAQSKLSDSGDIKKSELTVMKDHSGQQRLVWVVSYSLHVKDPGDSGLVAIGEDQMCIDANTGEDVTSSFR
ncbi:MAG: PepSY domain-containing protein [Candidatus Aquicultor sp.]